MVSGELVITKPGKRKPVVWNVCVYNPADAESQIETHVEVASRKHPDAEDIRFKKSKKHRVGQ